MCAKRALASSAALAASRGRMNTLGTDSMAAMERISLEHLHHSTAPGGAPLSPAVHILHHQIFWRLKFCWHAGALPGGACISGHLHVQNSCASKFKRAVLGAPEGQTTFRANPARARKHPTTPQYTKDPSLAQHQHNAEEL